MTRDRTADVVRELVEALIELSPAGTARHPAVAVGLAWLRRLETEEQACLPSWVKKKKCYNCGSEIFFAARKNRRPDGTIAWVPMCPYPIRADSVVLDALPVRFQASAEGSPSLEEPGPGVQWYPHSVLCGLRDRPLDPELGSIWDRTTGAELAKEEGAVVGLLKLLEETE